MKKTLLVAALALLCAGLALAAGPSRPPSVWQEGAHGFAAAAAEARAAGRPLLVYFYTDWCPYCREFQEKLLYSGRVEGHLREYARVRINPEKGEEEARLARSYGVGGYPALFLHARPGEQPQEVGRGTSAGGRRRLKTAEEFLATLEDLAGKKG